MTDTAQVTCRLCGQSWRPPKGSASQNLNTHLNTCTEPAVPWQDQFLAAVRALPAGRELTTAELHALVPPPHHPNAWGGATSAAARLGLIRVLTTQKSELPTTKSSLVRRWVRVDERVSGYREAS